MKSLLARYFCSWWLPSLTYIVTLAVSVLAAFVLANQPAFFANAIFGVSGIAFLGLVAASAWNLIRKRWRLGVINLLLIFGCGVATVFAYGLLMIALMFGSIEDNFADNLTLPEGVELADPDPDPTAEWGVNPPKGSDEFQDLIRKALEIPGNEATEFAPYMPSLRKSSSDHPDEFRNYIEASPDWHVFVDQGNRFATRRWSYGGEPRTTHQGYISGFRGNAGFQIRCLLCLDRKSWNMHLVQHVQEGEAPVATRMSMGNNLHESRVMIDCGGVWVEIFEQSGTPERRLTKATVAALEKEFSAFLMNPEVAVAAAQSRSRELAQRLAGEEGHRFRLITGMQPGIYGVAYSLNPGEPGSVYLKAYEVTKGTPLSVARLKERSKIRMTWSTNSSERFGAKAGFTIYEGDWGKPYAARFEVWFEPDSGKPERKLAERIFRIEGWQR